MKSTAISGSVLLLCLASGCAEKERTHPPVVARIDGVVKAISHEEAEELCKTNECEPNQIYTVNFGRRRNPSPPPAPVPTRPIEEPPVPSPDPGNTPPPTTGQPSESMDYSRNILGMSQAWQLTEGSREVIVAVVDTGVDYTHPDLYQNIWVNTAERNGQAGKDDDGNGYVDDIYGYDFHNRRPNGYDDGGHGTHCAGVIGALRNGIGVRGVSPLVKIMPLKFLAKSGGGDTADAVSAINYAVKMGAHVISNSWGGGGRSKFLQDAIDAARAKGILFIAAAGNDSSNIDLQPSYPASYPGVIAVGSSDSNDNLSSFSNYGKNSVMIVAPGSSIRSTYPGASYATMSGTSMATPQVAGAVALALAMKGNLTEAQIREDLCGSASTRLTSYSQCGRMNVGAFITAISKR